MLAVWDHSWFVTFPYFCPLIASMLLSAKLTLQHWSLDCSRGLCRRIRARKNVHWQFWSKVQLCHHLWRGSLCTSTLRLILRLITPVTLFLLDAIVKNLQFCYLWYWLWTSQGSWKRSFGWGNQFSHSFFCMQISELFTCRCHLSFGTEFPHMSTECLEDAYYGSKWSFAPYTIGNLPTAPRLSCLRFRV